MRNLSQYPITLEEKLDFLRELQEKTQKHIVENMICGDHSVIIINEIIQDVETLSKLGSK